MRDLTDRAAVLDVGAEDPAHDLGLGLVDHHVRGVPRLRSDPPVAVGHLPEEHLAGASAVQLAAAVALGDLRALVFGDHALDLDQQLGLRVIAGRRTVEEADRHAEALELFEDQHLVGVGAREAIRAQAQDGVQRAGLGRVAQAVQRGAVQPRARVAVVDELGNDALAPVVCRRAQQLQLRADRAALLLALGRDPRVYRDPHLPTARSSCERADPLATRKQ